MSRRDPAVLAIVLAALALAGAGVAPASGGSAAVTDTVANPVVPRAEAPATPPKDDVPVVDEMPVPVKTVSPVYPEAARKRGQQGTVYVQARVAKSGKVDQVKIPEGRGVAPDLDQAAVDAVRKWEFKPALLKGKPVATWVVIPIAFKLK
jgi:periplasmic protein TonB